MPAVRTGSCRRSGRGPRSGLTARSPPPSPSIRAASRCSAASISAAAASDDARQLRLGVLVDLADAAARQDVVELVAQQHAPGRLERSRELAAGERDERAQGLRGHEVALGAPVRALGAALGRERAAVQLEVEVARPGRHVGGLRRAREERVDTSEALDGQRREAVERRDPLHHLLGRAAAAVAVADRQQALGMRVPAARAAPGAERGVRPGHAVVAAVRVVEHVREHAAPVQPFPPEQVVREPAGLRPRQLGREEARDARAAQQLRQRRREAEAVGQPADGVR